MTVGHRYLKQKQKKVRCVDQKTSQYLVWPPVSSCSATQHRRIVVIVSCGMMSHSSWLCDISGYWRELKRSVVHVNPEHPKHAQWATCLSMQAMVELGHFQLPGIVYISVQHMFYDIHALSCWNMKWWRRMNDTTMGLRISSKYLCAFKLPSIKCKLCLLSVAYACPYHNPTATMGHSVHNQQTAICPVQLKLGFICEEHTSPACQWPLKVSIWPVSMPIACSLFCVTKLHILKCHFSVPSTRCTCVMIMLFNQLLDIFAQN